MILMTFFKFKWGFHKCNQWMWRRTPSFVFWLLPFPLLFLLSCKQNFLQFPHYLHYIRVNQSHSSFWRTWNYLISPFENSCLSTVLASGRWDHESSILVYGGFTQKIIFIRILFKVATKKCFEHFFLPIIKYTINQSTKKNYSIIDLIRWFYENLKKKNLSPPYHQ